MNHHDSINFKRIAVVAELVGICHPLRWVCTIGLGWSWTSPMVLEWSCKGWLHDHTLLTHFVPSYQHHYPIPFLTTFTISLIWRRGHLTCLSQYCSQFSRQGHRRWQQAFVQFLPIRRAQFLCPFTDVGCNLVMWPPAVDSAFLWKPSIILSLWDGIRIPSFVCRGLAPLSRIGRLSCWPACKAWWSPLDCILLQWGRIGWIVQQVVTHIHQSSLLGPHSKRVYLFMEVAITAAMMQLHCCTPV